MLDKLKELGLEIQKSKNRRPYICIEIEGRTAVTKQIYTSGKFSRCVYLFFSVNKMEYFPKKYIL